MSSTSDQPRKTRLVFHKVLAESWRSTRRRHVR
jgi:hypothetical protein